MISLSNAELIIGGLILYCIICYIVVWTWVLVKAKRIGGFPLNLGLVIHFMLVFSPLIPPLLILGWFGSLGIDENKNRS